MSGPNMTHAVAQAFKIGKEHITPDRRVRPTRPRPVTKSLDSVRSIQLPSSYPPGNGRISPKILPGAALLSGLRRFGQSTMRSKDRSPSYKGPPEY